MNKQTPYILVVDDEQDIRQLVSEILEDEAIKSRWPRTRRGARS